MIADADLPVCPFRVDWGGGVSERLEWKTSILADMRGNEQRQSLRLTPRREFEVTLTLWDGERTFWDLWLHRMAQNEFLFPLWHDSVRLAGGAVQGQNELLAPVDHLEFRSGSYALLRGLTAMEFEQVLVQEVRADRIILAAPLSRGWPAGTRLEPLIRGRLTDQNAVKPVSSRASRTQVVFEGTTAQLYAEGENTMDVFNGLPVLSSQPNRSEDLTASFAMAFQSSDSTTGLRYRRTDNGRSMVQQKHAWLLAGRVNKSLFRSLLYRLRGAAGAIWLPTFNDDLQMTRPAAANATSIYVRACGWSYTGGASSGREYVMFQLRDGSRLYRRIVGTAASANPAEERLVLDARLPNALALADVRRISFMDTARLQNDRIEMSHVNAADGASTVAGLFQTFRNERVPPAVLQYPIPEAKMGDTSCGDAPASDPCGPVAFPGWYWKVSYVISRRGPGRQPNYIGPPVPSLGVGADAFMDLGQDPANSTWSWGTMNDYPSGYKANWPMQFDRGTADGTTCFEEGPEGFCICRVIVQRWTSDKGVTVIEAEHGSGVPLNWEFTLP